MKKNLFRTLLLVGSMALAASSVAQQPYSHHQRGPISHHSSDRTDDEYRMSHLDGDAGDLIALVLPKRIADIPIKSGRWEPAESKKVRVVDSNRTSANIRLLSSGTTVVDFKYKYMKDGKEESGTYPFTVRIHRIDPEAISLPSTISVGWDQSRDLGSQVQLQPEYAECTMVFTVDDTDIAAFNYTGNNQRISGLQLGETTVHVQTSTGLETSARLIVVVPELLGVDLKSPDGKKFAVGDQMQLEASFTPARAQGKLTWSSDKPSVVSVDENGLVTAHAEGKATIRVVTDNGRKDSITLKVKN